jgi:hypothetical protein
MRAGAVLNIIFATGHSSPVESVILIKKAKEAELKKAVVTHCTQNPWFLNLDQAKVVLDNGGYLEHSVLPFFKGPNAPWRITAPHGKNNERVHGLYIAPPIKPCRGCMT